MNSNDFENVKLSYLKRICIIADRNRKKIINMDAWRETTCQIHDVVAKNNATVLSWWTKHQMKPSNKPHSSPTSLSSSSNPYVCKVTLSIVAANKQQSVLMKDDYKIELLDHSSCIIIKYINSNKDMVMVWMKVIVMMNGTYYIPRNY